MDRAIFRDSKEAELTRLTEPLWINILKKSSFINVVTPGKRTTSSAGAYSSRSLSSIFPKDISQYHKEHRKAVSSGFSNQETESFLTCFRAKVRSSKDSGGTEGLPRYELKKRVPCRGDPLSQNPESGIYDAIRISFFFLIAMIPKTPRPDPNKSHVEGSGVGDTSRVCPLPSTVPFSPGRRMNGELFGG